ncbi:---NA--- [Podarcis lilfordi]|uniref:---NA n=1 Tax=Podarcis lilfordi TaxID=74358 RepID=A0AA35NZL6_9SAUR|nr:---NA--- [Podarcis lilfordi]
MKMAASLSLVLVVAISCHISGVAGQGKPPDCAEILREAVANPYTCSAETGPVCGTDGWLYRNKCDLCTEAL